METDEIAGYAVMEEHAGWGSEYPDDLRNDKAHLKACFTWPASPGRLHLAQAARQAELPILLRQDAHSEVGLRRVNEVSAPTGTRLNSCCLAQCGCAQRVRYPVDGGAPVGCRFAHRQSEGADGIAGAAAVAEDAGTRLARVAHRLLPLHGVDVAVGHVVFASHFSLRC